MKMTKLNPEMIVFFTKPTAETLGACQEAWDQATDARWGVSYIHNHLGVTLRAAGITKIPSRAIVDHFIRAVQANFVPRPSLEASARVALESAVTGYQPMTPAALREVAQPAPPNDALKAIFDQFVAEEEARLLVAVRQQAIGCARARLHRLFDEMEPSNV